MDKPLIYSFSVLLIYCVEYHCESVGEFWSIYSSLQGKWDKDKYPGNAPRSFLMPNDISSHHITSPPLNSSSLIQLLTLICVSQGEAPLADGVVGGESLSGDGVVSGDGHGQDAGVGDHTARGGLATVPANVGTHWKGRGRKDEREKGD